VPSSNWEPPLEPAAVERFIDGVTAALQACYDVRPVLMHIYPVPVNVTPEASSSVPVQTHDQPRGSLGSDQPTGARLQDALAHMQTNHPDTMEALQAGTFKEELRRLALRHRQLPGTKATKAQH
jgi:hypothetical protein